MLWHAGAHAAHEVADLLRDYDNQDDFTVEMQQVDLPRLAQQVLLLEFQSVMRDT